MATAAGMMLVLHPLVALGLVVVWLLLGRVLHMASVASLVSMSVAPRASPTLLTRMSKPPNADTVPSITALTP